MPLSWIRATAPVRRHALQACLVFAAAASPGPAHAQTFQLSSADLADSAALARSMPRLAADVLTAYRDTDRQRYLDNLFRLQLLTGRYEEGAGTLVEARALRTGSDPSPAARAVHVQYAIYARAK